MASDIHAYFENMGETVVSALSPHWSEPLWAEAQLWLAGRATDADGASVSGYPAADTSTTTDRGDKRREGPRANRHAPFVDALALGSLVANLAMVLYLIH